MSEGMAVRSEYESPDAIAGPAISDYQGHRGIVLDLNSWSSRIKALGEQPVLRIGTFNAEAYWQPHGHARLPAVSDSAASDVVATLDELLLPWSGSNSALLTLLPVEAAQREYLAVALGLDPPRFSLFEDKHRWRAEGKPRCAYQVVNACLEASAIQPPVVALAPYSVTDTFLALADRLDQDRRWPSLNNVRRVNSKVFSAELTQRFYPTAEIAVVRSLTELDRFATALGERDFLVKEPFGVSGKGLFHVRGEATWKRLRSFITREEARGAAIEFVAEAFLAKSLDFSSSWEILPTGELRLRGVQSMENVGFKYAGSGQAGTDLIEHLTASRYYERVEPYLHAMHDAGYWGPLGIDSMLLHDGTIWPVVEINARESMGTIAQAVNAFLAGHGTSGRLTFLDLSAAEMPPYEQLLAKLDEHGLLWRAGLTPGVLPLTSASVSVNCGMTSPTRARWYVALVARTAAEQVELGQRFRQFCRTELNWWVH